MIQNPRKSTSLTALVSAAAGIAMRRSFRQTQTAFGTPGRFPRQVMAHESPVGY